MCHIFKICSNKFIRLIIHFYMKVSFSARKRFNEQRYVDGVMIPTPLEKKTYPFLVRTAPPFTQTNYARVNLFKRFGWKRVAIVHSNTLQSFEVSFEV